MLSSDGEYMLIDSGNNEDGDDIVGYLREVGADELKYVVGTHPHADHIGGMDDVILALDVENVLLPAATTNTQTYADVLDAIETKNVPVTVLVKGQTFQLGDAAISVIAAQPADDLNNVSIVLRATYEDTAFLFMGDAEAEVETAILSAGTNVRSSAITGRTPRRAAPSSPPSHRTPRSSAAARATTTATPVMRPCKS